MNRYIFDVDGTLTPSRESIDKDFEQWFIKFCTDNKVYIVTGSDKHKTIEQLGQNVWSLAQTVYQCSGNDVWIDGKNVRVNTMNLSQEMEQFFHSWLESSTYKIRTGQHIDIRPGLINFSIVGRGATKSERADYVKHDVLNFERINIAEAFNKKFGKDMVAQVAGETGLDIIMKGRDKSQIIHDFSPHDKLYFFGDKMDPDGNDYTLAIEVANSGGNVYYVKDWKETWEHLKKL